MSAGASKALVRDRDYTASETAFPGEYLNLIQAEAIRIVQLEARGKEGAVARSLNKETALQRSEPEPRSLFALCPDLGRLPHVVNESLQQGRSVVFPPSEHQRQRHLQVGDGQYNHAVRTAPSRGAIHPSHAHAM